MLNSKFNSFDKLRVDAEQSRSIKIQNSKLGLSLVELLVVVSVFSVLAVIVTQSLALTLKGSRKSESILEVRENLDFAYAVMERHIRNAKAITACSDTQIQYDDADGFSADFSCQGGSTGYLASGSARLTSSEIVINCNAGAVFACPAPAAGVAPSVVISTTASSANSLGIEGEKVTTSTKILLRTF
ncbi:MAG: prepilin-type N-terminal cleavage/methylation domain-containing protein [Patescibacteria group bacterium]